MNQLASCKKQEPGKEGEIVSGGETQAGIDKKIREIVKKKLQKCSRVLEKPKLSLFT